MFGFGRKSHRRDQTSGRNDEGRVERRNLIGDGVGKFSGEDPFADGLTQGGTGSHNGGCNVGDYVHRQHRGNSLPSVRTRRRHDNKRSQSKGAKDFGGTRKWRNPSDFYTTSKELQISARIAGCSRRTNRCMLRTTSVS